MDTQEIVLSEQQEEASRAFDNWYGWFSDEATGRDRYFVLDGYAGTGKSTVVSTMIDRMKLKAQYMAYTGKAAMVLSKNSRVNARTIHSTIYKPVITSEEEFKRLYEEIEKTEDEARVVELKAEIKSKMKPRFELREFLGDEDDPDPDVLVLDECSMVDDKLLEDILSFGIPVLALGDPGQLPPIDGTGALFKGAPNARLTEIRRQALDNPIIGWSMLAREQRTIPFSDPDSVMVDKAAKVVPAIVGLPFETYLETHDVVICWKNVTRQAINVRYRQMRGWYYEDGIFPVKGERLIITKNDRNLGIFNGQFCEVQEVHNLHDSFIELTVLPEGANRPIKLEVLRACFEMYRNPEAFAGLRPWDYSGKQQADFGYALTCHKAQGSQWDRVLVLDHNVLAWAKVREDRAKWLYTAVTRAVEKVTILAGEIN